MKEPKTNEGSQAGDPQALNRRGFVTTALGVGIFATGCERARVQVAAEGGEVAVEGKIFISLPEERYYAVPENALDPYRLDRDQFNAELEQKRNREARGEHLLDQSFDTGPEGSVESASEWERWTEFVRRTESESKGADPAEPTLALYPAVAGVRG